MRLKRTCLGLLCLVVTGTFSVTVVAEPGCLDSTSMYDCDNDGDGDCSGSPHCDASTVGGKCLHKWKVVGVCVNLCDPDDGDSKTCCGCEFYGGACCTSSCQESYLMPECEDLSGVFMGSETTCCPDGNLNGISDRCEAILLMMNESELVWTGIYDAFGYDVVMGDLQVMREVAGGLTASVVDCMADNYPDTVLSHVPYPPPPGPGAGQWFLVRGLTVAGHSTTYASAVDCQLGERDVRINDSEAACW